MSNRKRQSIKDAVRTAQKQDAKDREKLAEAVRTGDSFQNFAAKMGIQGDNLMSGSTYGFNPITRLRVLLEWIHRGSWIGGIVVDCVADDMTRAGIALKGKLKPEQISLINAEITRLNIWGGLNDTIKWARLYGGAMAVLLIEGQDMATPLRLQTVGPNMFKGLLILDRWMVEPSLSNLVTEYGPDLGLPKFYRITADAPALPRATIHHSRIIRLEGVRLPYWQRMQENLWGLSVLERLYDRMVMFDSATTGAGQLVYKAHLRTMKIKDFRQVVAQGGPAMDALVKYTDMMRRFQSIEGLSLIDAEDDMQHDTPSAFSGLGDALMQFGQQLSGATQIPLVRLFGQSPAGLNSTGESDLRTYYDGILQQQERMLHVGLQTICKLIAQSAGIKSLPQDFDIQFNPLWQLQAEQKAAIAEGVGRAVSAAEESGLISKATALKELRQSSEVTGVFTNITEDDIESAEQETEIPPIPGAEDLLSGAGKNEEQSAAGSTAAPLKLVK